MNKSEAINELATALAKAQGAMINAKKDSDNPFYKSKYADLASVIDAAKKPLADNGLSVIQLASSEGEMYDKVQITTLLLHSSGQWISEILTLSPTKTDPQGMGSAITYGRRYAYSAIIGMASEEDDDGNAASEPVKESPSKESYAIVDGAMDEISKASTADGLLKIHQSHLDKYNRKEITASQWNTIKGALTKRKKELNI